MSNAFVRCLLAVLFVIAAQAKPAAAAEASASLDALIAQHAGANGVPVSLVRRVIMRESRYNARAVSGGNYGLMQIRLGTARALGYRGTAAGLLDPDTNMTYAVRYLAGAYRAAGGNEARAIALYNSGYYTSRHRRRAI
jgi:soluble lytic murein transglycosylase-like protein